uniref:Uncharacterized protein bm-slt-1 n=1 Tax=Brugia malayi TaxID=6279 RepID=P90704_BRUMA|nr:unknown [Brugia malayi]
MKIDCFIMDIHQFVIKLTKKKNYENY